MSNVTNELILEHLKAIQAKLTSMDDRLGHIETDMRSLKTHMSGFMQTEIAQDSASASMQLRLERIERRLELGD